MPTPVAPSPIPRSYNWPVDLKSFILQPHLSTVWTTKIFTNSISLLSSNSSSRHNKLIEIQNHCIEFTPPTVLPPPPKSKPWGSNEFHRVRNILTTANDKSKQPTDTWKQKMATALQQRETRERRRREQQGEHQTLTLHQALTPQTPSLHLSRWCCPSDGDEDCYVRTVHSLQFVALGFFCSGKASI